MQTDVPPNTHQCRVKNLLACALHACGLHELGREYTICAILFVTLGFTLQRIGSQFKMIQNLQKGLENGKGANSYQN